MPAVQLRSLFSAGSGILIDDSGVISSAGSSSSIGTSGPGPIGPQGATGPQGVAGQGFAFRGAWQANTGYNPYDVVTTSGQTYVAAVTVLPAATFAATSWSLIAAQGGAGAPGAAGITGAAGPAGPINAATASALGAIKPGTGLTVATDGTLSVTSVSLGSLAQGSATVGQLLGWSGIGWAPTSPAAGVSYTGSAPITVASGAISIGQSGAIAGQVLAWSGTAWVPTTPAPSVNYTSSAPITIASGAISLGQSGATPGQVLTWSGTVWGPTTLPAGTSYSGSASITVVSGTVSLSQNGATTGQVLTWNGNNWVPQQPTMPGASVGTAIPLAPGTASAGLALNASREDHRHPLDSTRAPLANPVFTGSLTLPSWTTTTRPTSAVPGVEGFATDTGRRETFTSAGWVQYVRLSDLPAASGQLLAGTNTGGAATAVSIGSGLSLAGGTLSVLPAGSQTITGISIDGNSISGSTSSPYQMSAIDRVIDVNKLNGAASRVLLPNNPTLWVDYTIIDGKGDAGTNNITVSAASGATINGQASFVMNANNDAITLRAVSPAVWRVA